VVAGLAGGNLLQELSGVGKAMGNGNPSCHPGAEGL
jgi:hypothetical protein